LHRLLRQAVRLLQAVPAHDHKIDEPEGETHRVRHNVMGRGADPIRAEFEKNAALLKKRKNGVYLYHEIISITRAQGIDDKAQQELLHQIVQHYIEARCPENLVYGGLHQDKDHSHHFHLMISSNRAGETGRLRLTKKQFRDIQVQLEAHVLEKHPELEQQIAKPWVCGARAADWKAPFA